MYIHWDTLRTLSDKADIKCSISVEIMSISEALSSIQLDYSNITRLCFLKNQKRQSETDVTFCEKCKEQKTESKKE